MISEKVFEDTMNGVKNQMSEMKEEMSKMMMSMKNEVEEMRKDMKEQKRSVEFMSEFFDDLKKTNESLMNRQGVDQWFPTFFGRGFKSAHFLSPQELAVSHFITVILENVNIFL